MTENRKLQLVELDILNCFDAFCKRHDISYSLYGGTLLGAVRHKGFIPWDDDLDVCMLRSDYERFICLWNLENHEGYILQNKDIDPSFTQSFSKIRKDKTAFVQEYDLGKNYHKGIFIDIFPLDRMPIGFHGIFFKFAVMLYQLCCREFIPPKGKSSFLQRVISYVFLKLTTSGFRGLVRKTLISWIKGFSKNEDLDIISIETLSTLNFKYPHDITDNYTMLQFENSMFPAWSKFDEALSIRYGDYMKLPPESERVWTHHPVTLSFTNNE